MKLTRRMLSVRRSEDGTHCDECPFWDNGCTGVTGGINNELLLSMLKKIHLGRPFCMTHKITLKQPKP